MDGFVASVRFAKPIISDYLRPVVCWLIMRSFRTVMRAFVSNFVYSGPILIAIAVLIVLYSALGMFIFRTTYEDYVHFATIQQSIWSMTILLTTANFPDVMLPSYKKNYWSMIFFVSFLIVGLYVMMNFLLATVYNSFKS